MNIKNVFLPSLVSTQNDCKVANLLDPQYAHVSLTPFLVERFLQMLQLQAAKAEVCFQGQCTSSEEIYWHISNCMILEARTECCVFYNENFT